VSPIFPPIFPRGGFTWASGAGRIIRLARTLEAPAGRPGLLTPPGSELSCPIMGKVAVPDTVKRLVGRFDLGRKVFLSGDYKEEQLRAEFGQRTCRLRFLNPFSVTPADVLGQVYEQFLGKVIRLTAGHQAKVEAKPEVRKAGEPQPARLTNVCRCSKILPMSAQGRAALTGAELNTMSPRFPDPAHVGA